MVDVFAAGAATLAEASMEMPSIEDFLPPEILFEGTPFAINRIIFVRILATIIMLLVLGITAARAKLIPGRWQSAVEWVIDFVKNDIVYQVMGEVRGKRYVPMITTVFLTLLVFNLCGEIPGMNIAASATITLPLVFAMWCAMRRARRAKTASGRSSTTAMGSSFAKSGDTFPIAPDVHWRANNHVATGSERTVKTRR